MQAAFANGTLADVLDWEDCSWTGHPSAGAIPAALAVGEMVKASGKDYITSIVAGYEVYQRIAMAVQPSLEFRVKSGGWGLTSWQIFAAAIPSAKLLRLDEDKMAQAIGIAGALTPIVNGKVHVSRTDMYHYQHGLTSRDGVVSALMAESGINALYDMLDGDNGYWVTISDQCRWDWMTKGLGKDYLILETLFKHWPVNMWVQQYLDMLDAMMKEDKVRADDVSEIIVSPNMQHEQANRMIHRPEGYLGMTDAEFSIPYCLAAMLLDPEPGPNWFTDEKLKDPKILELASKVRGTGPLVLPTKSFRLFQEGKYQEAGLEVITKDGRYLSKSITFPKGHSKNRFTYDEYRGHFRRAASFMLKPGKVEAAMEKVLKLEEVDNVSEVTELVHN